MTNCREADVSVDYDDLSEVAYAVVAASLLMRNLDPVDARVGAG